MFPKTRGLAVESSTEVKPGCCTEAKDSWLRWPRPLRAWDGWVGFQHPDISKRDLPPWGPQWAGSTVQVSVPKESIQGSAQCLVLSGLLCCENKAPSRIYRLPLCLGTDPRPLGSCKLVAEMGAGSSHSLGGGPQSSSESCRSCCSSAGPWASSRHSSRGASPASSSGPPSAGRHAGYINSALSGRSWPWGLLITN